MKRSNQISNSLRRNFFATPTDGLISLFLILILFLISKAIFNWAFDLASWGVVTSNLRLYAFGSYPLKETWRPTLWICFIIILSILTLFGPRRGYIRKFLPFLWVFMIPFGIILLSGGFGLVPVTTNKWGGLSLTLILSVSSAAIALPLGILLAIGRQSNLILINYTCRTYIDLMRSVPLIAVLFFGQLLIPLFLPVELEFNRIIRAVMAFSLFLAAYIAEDIRGGLQAIPYTQKEAASALGLNYIQTLQLVILPQAIRTSLPALTNQAIGLLQNTSLMAILGLVELLGISQSLMANPNFIGKYLEVYVWLALIYWFVCTIMALLSKKLEKEFSNSIN